MIILFLISLLLLFWLTETCQFKNNLKVSPSENISPMGDFIYKDSIWKHSLTVPIQPKELGYACALILSSLRNSWIYAIVQTFKELFLIYGNFFCPSPNPPALLLVLSVFI